MEKLFFIQNKGNFSLKDNGYSEGTILQHVHVAKMNVIKEFGLSSSEEEHLVEHGDNYILFNSRYMEAPFRRHVHFNMKFHVGYKFVKLIENLKSLTKIYEKNNALISQFDHYPTVKEYIFEKKEIRGKKLTCESEYFELDWAWIPVSSFWGKGGLIEDEYLYAWESADYITKLIKELSKFSLDVSKLTKKSNSFNSEAIFKGLLVVGAKLTVKTIARSIGSNLDIDINGGDNIDFDIDLDNTNLSFDLSDMGDISDGISFHGKDSLPPNSNSDGYIPDGSISLTTTISDITKSFKHYIKDGHDYVLYFGNYIRVDGSGTVTIGGIKYDKI